MRELFEHEQYKRIPGTSQSYRQDPGITSTLTQKHAHVYGKLKGKGDQLRAVNVDGSGHDGSSGHTILGLHAGFFRSLGYGIKPDNILENLDVTELNETLYKLVILHDA